MKPSSPLRLLLVACCLLLHSPLLPFPVAVLSQGQQAGEQQEQPQQGQSQQPEATPEFTLTQQSQQPPQEQQQEQSQQQEQPQQADAQEGQATISTYDCVDPNNREITHVVRRGQMTTVCLYVGPAGNWNSNINYKRFSVNMQADEFSSYEIPGSFNTIKSNSLFNSDATHIFSASQSSLSFLRCYHDKTTQRFYPFLTAIIDVRDGIVRGIAWDDACVFCEKAECVPNTYNFDGSLATQEQINQPTDGCYFSEDECLGFAATGNNACDLKLYVVWTGTDVDGKVLLSSDSRFSMFPPNRIQENVNNSVNNMLEGVKEIRDKITSIGTRKLNEVVEGLKSMKGTAAASE